MAALTNTNLTLADWAKRIDPDGTVPIVAELLSQSNEILQDAVFKESNLPTGERVVIRTGLPDVYWRSLNQGIPSSKSTTVQVDEACGILEARSEVDKDLAMLNGSTAAFRLSEDTAFLEAMNQKQAATLFYGNPGNDPREYLGLATRYSASTGAGNAQNVISCGGAANGDNTSVYLVVWGDQTVYCPFPKGSKAGLIHEDLGEQTVYTPSAAGATTASATDRMQALVTRYQWKNGLVVKDWRYVVRICNIKVTELLAGTGTQAATAVATNLMKAMVRATYRIPNLAMGRPVFYMNRTAHSGLAVQAMDRSQAALKINEATTQFGTAQSYLSFLGIPIRRCDQILSTENPV
jgi:hypothetical protein